MTQTETQTAINAAVDGYFAMWNETDPVRRRELIQKTWTPGAHYVDPMFAADGPDGLDALVAGFHTQYANHRFQRTSAIAAHHDRARWDWELVGPDGGAPVVTGTDFAVFTSDSRLREVTGFFEPPAGAA
jgi:hypothetical protein